MPCTATGSGYCWPDRCGSCRCLPSTTQQSQVQHHCCPLGSETSVMMPQLGVAVQHLQPSLAPPAKTAHLLTGPYLYSRPVAARTLLTLLHNAEILELPRGSLVCMKPPRLGMGNIRICLFLSSTTGHSPAIRTHLQPCRSHCCGGTAAYPPGKLRRPSWDQASCTVRLPTLPKSCAPDANVELAWRVYAAMTSRGT